jgi:transcription initiation factor TFIIH subunit 2
LLEALKRIPSLVMLSSGSGDNFPSIQNGLAVAVASLQLFSKACSFGEVLLCYSSVFSVDPGNLLAWAQERLVSSELPVRSSAISFAGELYVLKQVSKISHGTFTVPLSEAHLREALTEYLAPPPDLFAKSVAKLAVVGFARTIDSEAEGICSCHVKAVVGAAFECPRCMNVQCSLPGECAVCGLLLVRSVHLSRSFASLWVVEDFKASVEHQESTCCFGCGATLQPFGGEQAMQCGKCCKLYCLPCDGLIHEQLQFCPGCQSR